VQRYRGNFGRLLVYIHKDGVDFQETMIREGFSPYFVKYGNAIFHHDTYRAAEREAQDTLSFEENSSYFGTTRKSNWCRAAK
jgi:endonuclease YncB( thermonuclease family)